METLRTKLLTGTTTTTQNNPQDVEATNAVAKNDDLELPVIVDFSGVAEMDFTAARVCFNLLLNNRRHLTANIYIAGNPSFYQSNEEIWPIDLSLRCE